MSQQDWWERFLRTTPRGSIRHSHVPGTVFCRGEGARLWDTDGNDWIDLTCGHSATNLGHAFAPCIQAAQQQLLQLDHVTGDAHVRRIELAESLIRHLQEADRAYDLPAFERKVLFTTSGARAIEAAWKAANCFRPGKLISLSPALHGRTIATGFLSDTRVAPLSEVHSSQAIVLPVSQYPHCLHCPVQLHYPECSVACLSPLRELLETSDEDISAVLVEPVLTARGYLFPPAEFLQQLRQITRQQRVLLIADEVQSGMGRCGALAASQAQGWDADLHVFGKSLGGGVSPIAAVAGRSEILDALPPGVESETFAAQSVACAVALEVLKTLAQTDVVQHGARMGEELRSRVRETATVGCTIEGQAACCVLEFHEANAPLEQAQSLARKYANACADQRLRVHWSGPNQTRVVLLPPLNIGTSELGDAIVRLRSAWQSLRLVAN